MCLLEVFGNAGVWSAKLKTMLPAASFADVNLAIPRKSTLLKVVFPSWPLHVQFEVTSAIYNGYIRPLGVAFVPAHPELLVVTAFRGNQVRVYREQVLLCTLGREDGLREDGLRKLEITGK